MLRGGYTRVRGEDIASILDQFTRLLSPGVPLSVPRIRPRNSPRRCCWTRTLTEHTLRIYAHLWPGEEDRTRTVMDAVLGGLRTGCGQEDTATEVIAGQQA